MLLSYYRRPLFILLCVFVSAIIFLNFLKGKKEQRIYYVSDTLCGRILSYPQESAGRWRFEFSSFYAGEKRKFMAYLNEKGGISLYDEVCFTAEILRPYWRYYPGSFNWRLFLQNKGIFLEARGEKAALKKRAFYPVYAASKVREKMLEAFDKNLSSKEAFVMAGVILGVKKKNDREISKAFSLSGMAHLLVASGGNVAALMGFFFFALRFAGFGRVFSRMAGLLACAFYVFVCGLDPPLVRAFFMAAAAITAFLMERKKDVFQALIIASLCLLLIDPNYLFDAGFQMSVLAVYGIACGFGCRKDFFAAKRNGLVSFLINLFFVSFFAQLALLPVLIYYFNFISIGGLISNMIAVPAAALLLPLGLGAALFSMIFQKMSGFIFFLPSLLAKILIYTADFFSGLKFSVIEVPNTGLFVLFSISLLIFVILHWTLFKNKRVIAAVSLLCLALSLALRTIRLNKPFEKEFYLHGERSVFVSREGRLFIVNPLGLCEEIKRAVYSYGFLRLSGAFYEGKYDRETALCLKNELKSEVYAPLWHSWGDEEINGLWAGEKAWPFTVQFKNGESGYSGLRQELEYGFLPYKSFDGS